MKVKHKEMSKVCPDCENRLGIASWDEGDEVAKSVKFAWKDKNGKVCRGGEVPVEVLPELLAFAKKHKYLK